MKTIKTLKKEDDVTLEMLDWGVSVGGEHLYGSLHGYIDGEYKIIELKKTLTESDVLLLNKKDKHISYKVGQKSKRFNTEDEVRKEAIKVWKSMFPNAKVLLEGQSSYVEPKKILDGIDMQITNMLNEMTNAYKRIPQTKDHKKQDAAYDSWIEILMDELKV